MALPDVYLEGNGPTFAEISVVSTVGNSKLRKI